MELTYERIKEDLDLCIKTVPGSWVVKYNGKCITLCSGKTIWKKKNHASAAFVNHIRSIYSYSDIRELGLKNGKELAHDLIKKEIVKIEEL